MIYCMSDILGNADAYFAMKENIKFSEDDTLYILGNVLGGNSGHPEDCLKILDDIMNSSNIKLLIGPAEHDFVLEEAQRKSELAMSDTRCLESIPGIQEFMAHIEGLPEEKRDEYLFYLAGCEVSHLVKVGRFYYYLCHGAPRTCNGNHVEWQKKVVSGIISIEHDYYDEIQTDPNIINPFEIEKDNLFIVYGGQMNREIDETFGHRVIVFKNKKIGINCGCRADLYATAGNAALACITLAEHAVIANYAIHLF